MKFIRKKVFFYSYIIILVLGVLFSFSYNKESAFALIGSGSAISFSDITLVNEEGTIVTPYRSDSQGSVYRVKIKREWIEDNTDNKLEQIEYSIIPLISEADEITIDDEGVITRNGKKIAEEEYTQKWKDENGVERTATNKDKIVKVTDLTALGSNIEHYGYFEVETHCFSAIVFKLKYKVGEDSYEYSYASKVYYCKNIDGYAPNVVEKKHTPTVKGYDVKVTLEDESDAKMSATSGVDKEKIKLIKKVGDTTTDVSELIKGKISELGGKVYVSFSVSKYEEASYYIYAGDKVGKAKDPFFILSINNAEYTMTNGKVVSETLYKNLISVFSEKTFNQKAYKELDDLYSSYRILVQAVNGDSLSAEEEKETRNKIESDVLPKLHSKYLELSVYFDTIKGPVDKNEFVNVTTTNEEYLINPIEVLNAGSVFNKFLYGEDLFINFIIGDFDPKMVNKTEVIRESGISSADRILTLNVTTENGYGDDYGDSLNDYLKIKMTFPKNDKVVVVQETIVDGMRYMKQLKVQDYNNYSVIYAIRGNGTINIVMAGSRTNNNLYWLLTLLIIPIGLVVFVGFKKKKAKKLAKAKREAEYQERKERLEKIKLEGKRPKNKSKK